MQKAFAALEAKGIAYVFHDYKKSGIDAATLHKWCNKVEYEKLINTSGLTWKKLDDSTKAKLISQESAIALMMQHTSMIRRPIIDAGEKLIIGFDEAELNKL